MKNCLLDFTFLEPTYELIFKPSAINLVFLQEHWIRKWPDSSCFVLYLHSPALHHEIWGVKANCGRRVPSMSRRLCKQLTWGHWHRQMRLNITASCCAIMYNTRHTKDVEESLYSDSCIQLEEQSYCLDVHFSQITYDNYRSSNVKCRSSGFSTLRCPVNAYITFTPRILPMWNLRPEMNMRWDCILDTIGR